jgi:hypothetical protein
MLNRLLNGSEAPAIKETLLRAMREAAKNPKVDTETLESIRRFLERVKD